MSEILPRILRKKLALNGSAETKNSQNDTWEFSTESILLRRRRWRRRRRSRRRRWRGCEQLFGIWPPPTLTPTSMAMAT
jgi:hypothetical protein